MATDATLVETHDTIWARRQPAGDEPSSGLPGSRLKAA